MPMNLTDTQSAYFARTIDIISNFQLVLINFDQSTVKGDTFLRHVYNTGYLKLHNNKAIYIQLSSIQLKYATVTKYPKNLSLSRFFIIFLLVIDGIRYHMDTIGNILIIPSKQSIELKKEPVVQIKFQKGSANFNITTRLVPYWFQQYVSLLPRVCLMVPQKNLRNTTEISYGIFKETLKCSVSQLTSWYPVLICLV